MGKKFENMKTNYMAHLFHKTVTNILYNFIPHEVIM